MRRGDEREGEELKQASHAECRAINGSFGRIRVMILNPRTLTVVQVSGLVDR